MDGKFNEYTAALRNIVPTRTSATLSNESVLDRHSMKHAEFIGGLMPAGTFIGEQ